MGKKNLFISNFSIIKKVGFKAILFLLPVFLIFFFPFLLMLIGGEILGPYTAPKNKHTEIFGLSYSYPVKYYKTKMTNILEPDILILGSSRSMQFNSSFFNTNYSTYCAGGAINSVKNFEIFWERIEKKPKFLILTIDPWWFNKNYDNIKQNYYPIDYIKPENPAKIFFNQWRKVYKDFFERKLSIAYVTKSKNKYGYLAIMKNEGFVNDGTYQYSEEKLARGYHFENDNYYKDAVENDDRFKTCNSINVDALYVFENFLRNACKEIGCSNVFIVYPAMPKDLVEQLSVENHANYYFLNDSIQSICGSLGIAANYHYCNNENENNMIDGIHPHANSILNNLKILGSENNNFKSILAK